MLFVEELSDVDLAGNLRPSVVSGSTVGRAIGKNYHHGPFGDAEHGPHQVPYLDSNASRLTFRSIWLLHFGQSLFFFPSNFHV